MIPTVEIRVDPATGQWQVRAGRHTAVLPPLASSTVRIHTTDPTPAEEGSSL